MFNSNAIKALLRNLLISLCVAPTLDKLTLCRLFHVMSFNSHSNVEIFFGGGGAGFILRTIHFKISTTSFHRIVGFGWRDFWNLAITQLFTSSSILCPSLPFFKNEIWAIAIGNVTPITCWNSCLWFSLVWIRKVFLMHNTAKTKIYTTCSQQDPGKSESERKEFNLSAKER